MDPSVLESHKSFPVFVVFDGKTKTRLDRALSLFADVRAGEGVGALLLTLNSFLILAGYYVLKTMRDTLAMRQLGPDGKAYMAAGSALLLMLVVPAYGAFASRVTRIKLVSLVTLFFSSHLLVFAALHSAGAKIAVPYYLWLGIFNYLLVGQFWAFANDLYDERKGKRIFPLVGIGQTLGGLAGAVMAAISFKKLGPSLLLLIGGVVLVLTVVLTLFISRREASVAGSIQNRIAREPIGKKGGFRLVLNTRYLLLIGAAVILLNLVNSTGQFAMDTLAKIQSANVAEADQLNFFARYAGKFIIIQNSLAVLLQMFVVSRVFRYFGVRTAYLILPVIAFGGYSLALLVPTLGALMLVKASENSTDYSIRNTAQQALFLPTSREVKYKAKIAIDSFFTRFGDMLSALLVFVGTQPWVAMGVRHYAAVNLVFIVVWVALVVAIIREHKRLLPNVS